MSFHDAYDVSGPILGDRCRFSCITTKHIVVITTLPSVAYVHIIILEPPEQSIYSQGATYGCLPYERHFPGPVARRDPLLSIFHQVDEAFRLDTH